MDLLPDISNKDNDPTHGRMLLAKRWSGLIKKIKSWSWINKGTFNFSSAMVSGFYSRGCSRTGQPSVYHYVGQNPIVAVKYTWHICRKCKLHFPTIIGQQNPKRKKENWELVDRRTIWGQQTRNQFNRTHSNLSRSMINKWPSPGSIIKESVSHSRSYANYDDQNHWFSFE